WLARIDGVRSTVTAAGALEIRHAVAGGTLVVSPASVRRVALCPERFALSMTLEDERGSSEVSIGTEDFYFAPGEARVSVDHMTFIIDDMRPAISWFETTERLRDLERTMPWAGMMGGSRLSAWLGGALSGAERVGLACEAERARFEGVLAA